MKPMQHLSLVLLALFFLSCLTDGGTTVREPEVVSVERIRSLTVNKRTIAATILCVVPTPCWEFARAD